MAASVHHSDRFGPLPLDLQKLSDWDDESLGFSVKDLTSVFPIKLRSLCKAYWLSKTFDYKFDLAYSATAVDPLGPGTDSGTVTGSGTSILLPNGTATKPGQRVLAGLSPVGDVFNTLVGVPYLVSGAIFDATSGITTPYSSPNTMGLMWNPTESSVPDMPVGYAARDFSVEPPVYYTSLAWAITMGEAFGQNVRSTTTGSNRTDILKVTIDGDVITGIPCNWSELTPPPFITTSLTGTIELNFNSFWP